MVVSGVNKAIYKFCSYFGKLQCASFQNLLLIGRFQFATDNNHGCSDTEVAALKMNSRGFIRTLALPPGYMYVFQRGSF